MSVQELIDELKKHDPALEVMIDLADRSPERDINRVLPENFGRRKVVIYCVKP